jgi:uncharacterized protein
MSPARIALFCDSHDRIDYLQEALIQAERRGSTHLIHGGDLCAPFVIGELATRFRGPIHIVFGNNDGDGRLCAQVAAKFDHVTLHGPYFEGSIGGVRCAAIHYPEPALRIAQSGQLDLVLYGHDHKPHYSLHGACHLVNPGELMGRLGPPSWGLFDEESGTYTRYELRGSGPT